MKLTEKDIKFLAHIYENKGECYAHVHFYRDCNECIVKRTIQLNNANYNTTCTNNIAYEICKRYIELYPETFMELLL